MKWMPQPISHLSRIWRWSSLMLLSLFHIVALGALWTTTTKFFLPFSTSPNLNSFFIVQHHRYHDRKPNILLYSPSSSLTFENVTSLAKGLTLAVVGLLRLCIRGRVEEFKWLVNHCEYKRGGKETTCAGLDGFRDMFNAQPGKSQYLPLHSGGSQTPRPCHRLHW